MQRLPNISRPIFLAALCLLTLACNAFGQRRYIPRPDIITHRPVFDVFQSRGVHPDSTRIDLYTAVPYSYLEFLYAVDKYVATYGVDVQVLDRDTAVLDHYEMYSAIETGQEHRIRIDQHEEKADAQQLSFSLKSGRQYQLRLIVRDQSSHHEFDTTVPLAIRDFHLTGASMSDLLIYRNRRGLRIVPAIGGDVSTLNGQGGLFAQLYDMPGNSTLGVVTEVFNTRDGEVTNEQMAMRATTTITTAAAAEPSTAPGTISQTPFFEPLQFDDLWTGEYRLRTYILPRADDTAYHDAGDLAKHALAWTERPIGVRTLRGIPISIADLDQAIDQLRLIATGSEWDSLSSASNAKEKRDAILDFWRKRNPEPGRQHNQPMEVFYSRIDYANTHFGSGFSPGWKSDRGRVYIALGPPDVVDSHPYEAMQKPYEVWTYDRFHARYDFVDEYMLGDFRLRGPGPMPGTFVWDR